VIQPQSPFELSDGSKLRFHTPDDADAVARAVRESLEHLRPWMPWADEQSAKPAFQVERIRKMPELARRQEEWQYGLFAADESRVLGSFGLMTRRGPGTIEIGYWVHVDAIGHGHATRATRRLAEHALSLDGVRQVVICCDEANERSAAIPRRLGFSLVRVESRPPEAPGERGRLMIWTLDRGQPMRQTPVD
jgi:RimJ/RimL family protein N-acetyltransferase